MKKIAYLTILSALSLMHVSAHAQNFRLNQSSTLDSPLYSTYSLSQTNTNTNNIFSNISQSQSLTLGSPLNFDYIPPNKQTKRTASRGLFVNQLSSTTLHFSKSDKLDYGVDFSLEQKRDPYEMPSLSTGKHQLNGADFSTSAFLNYRITPNYSLGSSIRYASGYERGTQFSVSAKANKVFAKRHNLTAVFSVNWNNSSNTSRNPFNTLDWQQSRNYLSLNQINRTELRIGGSWNWNIDTNWTLSTGVNAHRTLNSPINNPFFNQRTPVTVFSIATYRF